MGYDGLLVFMLCTLIFGLVFGFALNFAYNQGRKHAMEIIDFTIARTAPNMVLTTTTRETGKEPTSMSEYVTPEYLMAQGFADFPLDPVNLPQDMDIDEYLDEHGLYTDSRR